jgi:MarR-like DNA-binding transcriptional regulator SgrR of sgrS sRNA
MSDGGREPEFELDDVIDVFEAREDYAEPLTASEVADVLGCSRRTALNKLGTLAEETEVTSKKVGGRSRVWWIPVYV